MNGFPDPSSVALRFGGRSGEHTDDQRAAIASINARIACFIAHGWSRRDWRPTSPGSPCIERVAWEGGWYVDWDAAMTRGWMDHPYRLILPDKQVVFVAEPYWVDDSALVRLAYLRKTLGDGGRVRLLPEMAMHYPGRTVAIWIERKGAAM